MAGLTQEFWLVSGLVHTGHPFKKQPEMQKECKNNAAPKCKTNVAPKSKCKNNVEIM